LLPTLPGRVTGFQLATENVDFEFSEQTITFPVADQFQNVAFRIIGDAIPEGAEAFALRVDRNRDGPPLLASVIPETTIAIMDDDGEEENRCKMHSYMIIQSLHLRFYCSYVHVHC